MGRDGYVAPSTPVGTRTRATAVVIGCRVAKKEMKEEEYVSSADGFAVGKEAKEEDDGGEEGGDFSRRTVVVWR